MKMNKYWKSQEEIDEEKRLAKEEKRRQEVIGSPEERIEMLEEIITILMMEGLNGGEK